MSMIEGYSITSTLYTSDRSTIYRARRIADGLPVVLKTLVVELPSLEEVARLRREFRLTRHVASEGIIDALAFERFGAGFAIVLEDFGGESLTRVFGDQAVEPIRCLRMASRVARILGRVHRKHIMHKDINPSNLLWNANTDELKLIDFGISAELSRETPAVFSPHVIEGTLPYISPEATGRMNRAVDYRTDFYSLGVTLYRLLTGRLPFPSTDPIELVHCHIARIPTSPSEINPAIPAIVSDIVLRLMAKVAGNRYQNAFTLAAHLERCADEIDQHRVTSFSLTEGDVSERMELQQKLYGREKEIELLLSTFDRASEGHAEMMLVAGHSGIGKSALIQEVHKPIIKRRGYFASGKFDQFNRDIPYASLIQAIKELVRQILTEPKENLAAWKQHILEAIRPNAQLIIDVIPEVELIVGKQPAVASLPPRETQNRFNHTFEKFFGVFATKDHPLALFLDDLQWADLPSLMMLERLMEGFGTTNLLLICAYRDNEVDAAHPFMLTVDAIRKQGATIHHVTLNPLGVEDCVELIADALRAPKERVASLAQVCLEKTGGNPFFLRQFLLSLYDAKQIDFDDATGQFQWDTAALRQTPMTDNVVALMAAKIQKFSADTQRILQLAACIGNVFDLRTLSMVAERSAPVTANLLWDVLREDLIIPLDDAYKFIDDCAAAESMLLEATGEQPHAPSRLQHVAYRFLHDRVQQAAYSLISEDERRAVHLQVGRFMLASNTAAEQQEQLFTIVGHLNLGSMLITEQIERDEIAKHNLTAGRKAQASAAHAAAKAYFEAGIHLLGADRWSRTYDLTLALHTQVAEASYLCTAFDDMEHHIEQVLANARQVLDQVKVLEVKIQSYIIRSRYMEAVLTARRVWSLLGVEFPEHPVPQDVAEAMGKVHAAIGDRSIEALGELPRMTDPVQLAVIRIIAMVGTATYASDPALFPLLVLHEIAIAARHGNTEALVHGYCTYGMILAGAMGDIDAGYAFGQLAMRMLDSYNAREYSARTAFIWNTFIRIWKDHVRESFRDFQDVYRVGIEVGDLEFAGWSAEWICEDGFFIGIDLSELNRSAAGWVVAVTQNKQQAARNYILIVQQAVQNLLGLSPDPCRLSGAVYDEEKMLPEHIAAQDRYGLASLLLYKLQLAYLFGRYELAREHADSMGSYIEAKLASIHIPAFYFFDALTRLALFPQATPEEQGNTITSVADSVSKFEKWAKHAPANFAAKLALIQAERHRVLGQTEAARGAYYQAIKQARSHEYRNDEALAVERFAAFLDEQQEHEISRIFRAKAHHLYQLWGATAKVRDMEQKFPEIVAVTATIANSGTTLISSKTTESRSTSSLDLLSAIKASQAISGEVVLPNLLEKLMEIVLENAGARWGLLMMQDDTQLIAEARRVEERGVCEVKLRDSLEQVAVDYSPEIVRYVQRTHEPVILGDGSMSDFFKDRLRNTGAPPQSVLCLPILHQKKLVSVLYLENELIPNAFTWDRCMVLELLASQAAISLDNAKLYSTLERKVEQRTKLLQEKNEELEATLERLRKAQNELVQAEKMASMGRLTMGIAHELKNPLNFIINFAGVEENLVGELKEALEDVADTVSDDVDVMAVLSDLEGMASGILRHGARANDIIQSMMRHATNMSGERTATHIDKLLDQAIKLALEKPTVAKLGTKIVIERDDDPSVGQVPVMPQEMLRVYRNILENAVDAVIAKRQAIGLRFTPTLRVSTRREQGAVRICVQDNGVGIAPDVLRRIFEPFFTTKPTGTGIGLGLSMAYDIVVHGHHGTIECESIEGQGATFVIVLPG